MLIFLDLLKAEFQLMCEVFLGHFNRLPSPEHLICEMFVDPVWGSGRRTPPLFHGADPSLRGERPHIVREILAMQAAVSPD